MAMHGLSAALLLCSAALASEPPVDWHKAHAEALGHLRALLRINTVNPPGGETVAAQYLKRVLDRDGVPNKLLALEPQRANLVARIHGDGTLRPLAILGHTDTVGFESAKWSVNPLDATRRNGFLYGRGTIDDKDIVTAGLMVMLLLERTHVRLHRDIIFIAEAGEEGSPQVGIDYLIARYWPEIAAEYALAEGGAVVSQNGSVRYAAIATTEKVPRGVRLIAHGAAGHASRPSPDNVVVRLSSAIVKLAAWRTPMRLNETTRTYFERLAAISSPEDADRYRHVGDPARAPEIDRYFERYEPAHYAILHTTLTPTLLKAGFARNVIPSEGEAYVDVRALPEEDMTRLYEEMRTLVGGLGVEVVPRKPDRPDTAPSRTDTALFRALEQTQHRMFPRAVTVPAMLTGATDLAQLRARGVEGYGIGPVVDTGDRGEAHADDERIREASLYKLVEFLWYTVLEIAA